MKINSISGLTYQVQDLDRTAAFYETLGFRLGKRDDRRLTCYVNWFWVEFTLDGDGAGNEPGAGPALSMKVDDIAGFHADVLAAGLTPAAEPAKARSGRKEFHLLDPDGNRLVFFAK